MSPLLRRKFDRAYIVNGGFDFDSADAAIRHVEADLIAFVTLFLANSDLPPRSRVKAPLNVPDQATFYAGEDKGFIDYPALASFRYARQPGKFHENSKPRIDAE